MAFSLAKLSVILILVGIAARLFSIFVLPESAYSDALFNLTMASNIIGNHTVLPIAQFFYPALVLAPLYHVLNAAGLLLAGATVQSPTIRVLPVVLSSLQLVLSFLLLRTIFPKNRPAVFLGLAFVAMCPWLIRYGTVNYTETLASVLVLATLLFLLRMERSQSLTSKSLAAILIAATALSRLNMLVFFVPFAMLYGAHSAAKSRGRAGALAFLLVALILSGAWFGFAYLSNPAGSVESVSQIVKSGIDVSAGDKLGRDYVEYIAVSHASLYDFPPLDSFPRVPLLAGLQAKALLAIFSLAVLPITVAVIFGMVSVFRHRTPARVCIALTIILALAFAFVVELTDIRPIGMIYVRYMIPVMPLLAVPLADGFTAMHSRTAKRLVVASLALFAFYSLAYTSVSAQFYLQNYIEQQPLFSAVSALPQGATLYAEAHNRAIGFYSGHPVATGELSVLDGPSLSDAFNRNGIDYVADTCYRSPWNGKLKTLESNGLLSLVYADACNSLYAVSGAGAGG